MNSLRARLHQALAEHRHVIAIFLAALFVRLLWNLVIHPPGNFIYSDMQGYNDRAIDALQAPFQAARYQAFYPYGTHVLFAALKFVFGRTNYAAIGVVLAALGACLPVYTFLIARRVSGHNGLALVAGWITVFFYPLISLGGYLLSEIPFCFTLLAAIYYLLRLVDDGQTRDAKLAGWFAALAVPIRPQILIGCALFAVYWLVARRFMPRVQFAHLKHMGLPIAIVLFISVVRFNHHTGEFGLISENGSLNMMFGRCHAQTIAARDQSSSGQFTLPEFAALQALEDVPAADRGLMLVHLAPALGPVITYQGYIGDQAVHVDYIRKCMAATGWMGQASYSFTHLVLLWGYNVPWPDSDLPRWQSWARLWQTLITSTLLIPACFGLVAVFRPHRNIKLSILNLQTSALFLTSLIYFGGTRLRNPYDPLFLVIGTVFYFNLYQWWRGRRPQAPS